MKKIIAAALSAALLFTALTARAGDEIVKTGYNIGPLPAIAYDADKGFQYGAILQLFNYGDGHNYPNYDSKLFLEASFFTKGSNLFTLSYDNKELIPGVRWSSAITSSIDKAMDFYGFNGYRSSYDWSKVAAGKAGEEYTQPGYDWAPVGDERYMTSLFNPFYRISRVQILGKTDFIGKIGNGLYWEAGYHASWIKIGSIDRESVNKGKSDTQVWPEDQLTLYDWYRKWGLISDDEAEGGFTSSIRLGLQYDTRDKEGAPSSGVWAEGHIIAAPKWLGTKNEFYRYAFTWRHYLPVIDNNVLTFAYRLNYEGTIGDYAPFYVLPYITVMGENCDKDGFGGYRTVRGIMRDRVMGLDTFTYTAELRWRFMNFRALNQNIALALSAFSDGSMVTKERSMEFAGSRAAASPAMEWHNYLKQGAEKDSMHVTFGAGFRFIMNENFIVAFEYGTPLSHWMKNSANYNQDGTGAFYVNIGYLF